MVDDVSPQTMMAGFPQVWTPFRWPQTEIFQQIPVSWPVLCILGALGQSIHAVVNDPAVREQVRELFKAWKEIERRDAEKDQEAWDEWIHWCQALGCPV